MRLILAAAAVVLTLASAGCDRDTQEGDAAVASPPTARNGPEAAAAVDSASAVPAPAPDSRPPPAPATPSLARRPSSAVALDSEGLRLADPATGSTRPLAFGVPANQAENALTASMGRPQERAANPECGAGPLESVRWSNGFAIWLQGDRFAGWALREGARGAPTTLSGVGLGSSRRELEAAYQATIAPSTLGTEFAAGGLFGLLSSAAPDARITTMWAGASCVFR